MSHERLRPAFTFDAERLEQLKAIAPEAFADGKINWEALRATLGDHVEEEGVDAEHFGLFWPGKRAARRRASEPSRGTLISVPGEGVNEDTTRNVFIEADNLDALKLLQKAYTGRVKMIYIDPPYNTGSDFVYRDDFREAKEDYLRRTGQISDQGEFLTTNSRADGRYHSNWLNMMYPRLRLARSLLADDGIIFVSIDDNEGHNLRPLLAEIFGEENYLVTLYIQVRYPDKTLVEDADFHKLIEQVIVFGKTPAAELNRGEDAYSYDKFVWEIIEDAPPTSTMTLGGKQVDIFVPGQYTIRKTNPSSKMLKEIWATGKILDGNSSGRFFRDYITGRTTEDGYGVLYKVHGIGGDQYPYRYFTGPKKVGATKGKYYQGVPSSVLEAEEQTKRGAPISNFYNFADSFGNCRHEGGIDFRSGKKPIAFLKLLLGLATKASNEDIVMDFFAGSGSTGHAVFEINREDGGNRRFILTQLPEPPRDTNNEFSTISALTRERLRRSIGQLKTPQPKLALDEDEVPEDLGFRAFKYVPSAFKLWENYSGNDIQYLQTLFDDFETPLVAGWNPEHLLSEIMLLLGFPLDSQVEQLEAYSSNRVTLVSARTETRTLIFCLDSKIADGTINQLQFNADDIFVCLDNALTDQTKARLADVCNLRTI